MEVARASLAGRPHMAGTNQLLPLMQFLDIWIALSSLVWVIPVLEHMLRSWGKLSMVEGFLELPHGVIT